MADRGRLPAGQPDSHPVMRGVRVDGGAAGESLLGCSLLVGPRRAYTHRAHLGLPESGMPLWV